MKPHVFPGRDSRSALDRDADLDEAAQPPPVPRLAPSAFEPFTGTGPGERTADGCSVELYRQLPYLGDIAPIEPLLLSASSVLELGCGTGRIGRRLQELGLTVTGVDASAAMLHWIPEGMEGVHADIRTFRDERRWSAVLLATNLINHPDDGTRHAFLHTARSHLAQSGRCFVQRHDPAWLQAAVATPFMDQTGPQNDPHGAQPEATQTILHAHEHHGIVRMTIAYTLAGSRWTHAFAARALSEEQLENEMRAVGFRQFAWLGERRLWCAATTEHA